MSSSLSESSLTYLVETCLSLGMHEEAYEYSLELQKRKKNRLNETQRNLYMRSMKGKLNSVRNSWKVLVDFEGYEGVKEVFPPNLLKEKKEFLENEIKTICLEVSDNCRIFETNLSSGESEAKIFYLKLKADYLRYLCEVSSEKNFEKYKEICNKYYDEAYQLGLKKLQPTSPLFLSVALNYSVSLYTLSNSLPQAYNKANEAYKKAILCLVPEQKVPEVESLLRSLEENLTIWRAEITDENR